jgi:hypothetical protein
MANVECHDARMTIVFYDLRPTCLYETLKVGLLTMERSKSSHQACRPMPMSNIPKLEEGGAALTTTALA